MERSFFFCLIVFQSVHVLVLAARHSHAFASQLKDPTALNEFIKIIPVIKKQEGFPEVVYNASLRLADCQSEKHLAYVPPYHNIFQHPSPDPLLCLVEESCGFLFLASVTDHVFFV